MQLIEAGRIVNTHGLRGEVKIDVWMNESQELCSLDAIYFGENERMDIERARANGATAIVKLAGVDSPEAGEKLKGKLIYVEKTPEKLAEGEYYIEDIIGLEVFDADRGTRYGVITDVYTGIANDAYEIRLGTGKTALFPAIKDVIVKTDIAAKRLEIRPLNGMFDI